MAIVQSGTPATPAAGTTSPITGAWGTGQNRTAGNLLVALVVAGGTTSAAATAQNAGTTGWTKIFESTNTLRRAAIWTKPATGGDAAPAFTSTISGTGQLSCYLIELTDNVTPGLLPTLDTGNQATGTTGTLTTTTAATVAVALSYAVAVDTAGGSTSAANTWGTSGSWTNSFNDGVTANGHWVVAVQASPTSGSTLAYAPTHTITSTQQGGAVAVFRPGGFVAFDAAGPSSAGTAFTATTGTWTHVNTGNGIFVGCTVFTGTTDTITAVTYGGVALNKIAFVNDSGGGVSFWGLIGATCPTGSNTVSVTKTGANNCNAGSVSVFAAGSLGTPATASNASNATSQAVTVNGTTTNGLIVTVAAHGAIGGTWGLTGGTTRWIHDGTSNSGADNGACATISSTGGGANQTITWTNTTSDAWAVIAVEVLPAAPAGGVPVRVLGRRTPLVVASGSGGAKQTIYT